MKRLIIWSIIATGISSVATQLITIREFLTQFHGNEITISLVLFAWLMVNAIGSLLAKPIRRGSITLYCILILLIAIWSLPQLILIRLVRDFIFIHGVSPGFYRIFYYIILTIAPYCLMVGFVLPFSLKVMEQVCEPVKTGTLYVLDNIGDIGGGVLFSFFLVYWLKPFKAIAISSLLLILISLLIVVKLKKYMLSGLFCILTISFYILGFSYKAELSSLEPQYGNILSYIESPYGRIVITSEYPQHTFWESGVPFYSDANIVNSEEKVHYPLCQLDRVRKVLLISGGLGETLSEIKKYNPDEVDYVELDPYMTESAIRAGVLKKDSRVSIHNMDGRRYIKTVNKKYDAIIIDLPEPDTFQINRFYTDEFFELAKVALREGGVLSFNLDYSPNYISKVRRRKLSIIYNTAKRHFKNIIIIPGMQAYFICRDGPLTANIPQRLKTLSIQTSYIEGFYSGNVTDERLKMINSVINKREGINRDFEPRAVCIMFREWFFKHGTSPNIFFFILIPGTVLYLLLIRKEEYLLFTTGMVNMSTEMLIILTFQIIHGYVYLKVGAIITAFLGGLLPGALIGTYTKDRVRDRLILLDYLIFLMLGIFLIWALFIRSSLSEPVFLIYCFIFSFFCGYQFPLSATLIGEEHSPASGCISADLLGAGMGVLLTGTLLVPYFGIMPTIIILMIIKVSSIIIFLFKREGEVMPT